MTIPPFLIPIAAGLLAQALKPLLSREWRRDQAHRLDPRPRYGGMPSAHTAFATSLATIVSLTDGARSMTFALAVALLVFALDDALRLRVFLGRFGTAIRQLTFILPVHSREHLPPVEERIGHSIPEVFVGALIGIVSTVFLWSFDS
jgi:acid phosphatase family membrane protein YuiD